jgi:hypothetical protein
MKLVRLIKMCFNKTDNKVWTGKYLSERFATQIDLKQGHTLLPLHFSFALECPQLVAPGKPGGSGIKWDTATAGLH